jgi:carbon storage regulator
MLILVRKVQQGIWIEGDIFVKVLSVERDRVKLGITAPTDVKVMRQELFGDDVPQGAAVDHAS